jgi:hypothetical protein
MPELDDLSGPFRPDIRFEDFSRDFLLKLIPVWQYAWLYMTQSWWEAVKDRFGMEAASECETQVWTRIGERVNPRYAKVANIELNTVVDSLKALYLPLDNPTGGQLIQDYDIKSPNHVILTVTRCPSLEYFEAKQPERINWVCRGGEKQILEKYLINPKIKLTPLKLPPRKSKDEIACQWELKLEE